MGDFSVISKKIADFLAKRPHFKREVQIKLLRRGFDSEEITVALKDFEKRGYLNDQEVAISYLEELKRKKVGKIQALKKLTDRGLERELASSMVSSFFLENDEIENIKYLLDKKGFDLSTTKGTKKAWDFLTRKGYEYSLISQILVGYQSGGLGSED